ncbi:related to cytochrome p450 7a1 [Cephalotrichum gorgonifer]|uniref:Related to cytochrome p450 7a1 n=1 Tax=Cephalotrichum gorgonifer TaxID=2041049 RepID=A0AAE8SVA6_9PEZI|nr:related to cytochrome p450 7a1 [Cephalotrichum gorgonifer]
MSLLSLDDWRDIDVRLALLVSVLATPALTFLITSASARYRLLRYEARGENDAVEPPTAPFAVPGLAHTVSFAFKTASYIGELGKRFGSIPLRLRVAGMDMYYVPPGATLHGIFKNSRQLSKHMIGIMLKRQFGMREEDIGIWAADESGIFAQPAPGHEGADPAKRLWHIVHRDLQTHLSGTPVNIMTAKFAEMFARRITGSNPNVRSGEWTELPDLYAFLRVEMLYAAVEALCGTALFDIAPTFVEDFWAYDDAFPTIFRRIPKFIAPGAYAARERMHEHMKAWHLWAGANFDWESPEALEADWEPVYGSKIMRARAQMVRNAGMTIEGVAALDAGFVWTANANAIPAAIWAVFDIIRVEGLRERVLAETEPCFTPHTLDFDLPRLCSLPLLTSVYMEELRLRAAATVTRQVVTDDFSVGPWWFRRGANIFALPWFGGRDAGFWNTGREGDERPVARFWAERFLEYPEDPASGPVRDRERPEVSGAAAGATDGGEKVRPGPGRREKTSEDDARARVVTTGIQGHYYPYGGGVKICPGRFFAKQEIMVSVAVLLRACEIELVDPEGAEGIGEDMGRFPLGTLPPDGKIPFRIRRRL